MAGPDRPVQLQRLRGSRWVGVARTPVRRGRWAVTLRARPGATAYRVVAPATRAGGRRLPRRASRVRTVHATQSAALEVRPATLVGEEVPLRVVALPARAGRPLLLEQLRGGTWAEVATLRSGAAGAAAYTLPGGTTRTDLLRVTALPWRGAPATTSPERTLDRAPRALPRVGWPQEAFPVNRTQVTVVDVPQELEGPVEVFLDGVRLGRATRCPASAETEPCASGGDPTDPDALLRHTFAWDTTLVPNGPHDFTARTAGRHGRLADSVRVTVLNAVPDAVPTGLPEGFSLETVASGFTLPTQVEVLTGDSALVAEKGGTVRLVRDGRIDPRPVLDLGDRVVTEGDMGLVAMAVGPRFDRARVSGDLYLGWVHHDEGRPTTFPTVQNQRVSRFVVRNGVADPRSERVLLGGAPAAQCEDDADARRPGCLPALGTGHTVDDLLFAPDGSLFVSVGDGILVEGDSSLNLRAQDLDTALGKVLRIDPATGRGLRGNPFVRSGTPLTSHRARVWAYGLRNPFRMTRNPRTGRLYVGDVGNGATEEVDVVRPGANFGWPCFEGTVPQDVDGPVCAALQADPRSVTAPAWSYPHTERGGSVVGGAFYTGGEYPPSWDGTHVVGDYAQGFVSQLRWDARDRLVGEPVPLVSPEASGAPVAFEMGPDGRLWYVAIGGFEPGSGQLRRLRYAAGCQPGEYVTELFASTTPTGTPTGTPAARRCDREPGGSWGAGAPDPALPADGFAVRWTGRPTLPGGTYRFSATTDGALRVEVDGRTVLERAATSGPTATTSEPVRLGSGQHRVVVEYAHVSGEASLALTRDRVGTAPTVRLTAPWSGLTLLDGETVDYTAVASDAEDGPLGDDAVEVLAETVHYPVAGGATSTPHSHPAAVRPGRSGSVRADGVHAPGRVLMRLTARATDSSGWTSLSAPVWLCVDGNRVGPCVPHGAGGDGGGDGGDTLSR
ncbi:PQQ-dependent sugar dehydrogenase [Nocardioides perillae]|uniref:Glucose/arabinose dehydrogenase n=1 Tax=Nocardioides perillae TaxID=1119534 RepID=A0A7Y9RWH6_9ACTN|nr:PQQ-dependent sugar dehydrogenase [Nocardioides perillae]NYG55838.1 glucose/arabinose dehydrogenase [Nocardioides perillae]